MNSTPPCVLAEAAASDHGATVHGTCVVIGGGAVIIRGPSGGGKSDLALRLIDRGAMLLSDDYTYIERENDHIAASPPPNISGLIEVRGLGIVSMPHIPRAVINLVVELLDSDAGDAPVRYPLKSAQVSLLGVNLPVLRIVGFETSAPIKIEMALSKLIDEGAT